MQIADIPVGELYVSDVAYPQPVGGGKDKTLDQVFPLVIAVVGIRRVADLPGRKHQPVLPQKRAEAVATGHELLPEESDEHYPQLVAADTGILVADLTHGIKHETFTLYLCSDVGLRLVEGLTAMAKQTAGQRNFHVALTDQFRYYLAPDFFSDGDAEVLCLFLISLDTFFFINVISRRFFHLYTETVVASSEIASIA